MIKHFEQAQVMEPEDQGHFQVAAALGAGLIPGVLLLLAPRGSPWAGVSFFSSVIMGRPLPAGEAMSLPVLCIMHLAISIVYGLVIAAFLARATQGRAILLGGVVGAGLYLLNFAIVT